LAHSVHWSSAQVEPIGDFYELRVNLDAGNPEPLRNWVDQSWTDAFNDEATRRYKAARGQPWGNIAMAGDTVIVQELEPGAEADLIRYLDALVTATDEADDRRPAPPNPTQSQADKAREHATTAAEMAKRFRAG
jgi:hypothetical protein